MTTSSLQNLARYGIAVIAVCLATAVRLAMDPVLGDLFPFSSLFLAILVVAAVGGRGPALLAVGLGAVASARFLLPPRDSIAVVGFDNQAGLVLYVAVGAGIAWLGGALKSARQRAEDHAAEANRQREQLRITLNSIGDAMLVTDADGRIMSMNPVAETITGWSATEAAGLPLPEVFRIVNEETRGPVDNPALRVLKEGVVVGLANHTILIARDGNERPIDDSAAPILDEQGRVAGVVLIFRDVTERRRQELLLKESEQRSRAILESITDAFFALGRDWRFTYVNRQAEILLDRQPGDLIGQVLWEAFPGLVGSEFEQAYRRAVDEQVAISITSYYPDDDRWYEVHNYPTPHGLSVYFRNVTDRKLAEERERLLLEEAATANAKFRAFFEQGPLFSGIMTLDGFIVEPNRLSLEACGYTREEVVGKPFWECPWWNNSATLVERIKEASAQAAAGTIFRGELPYFVASGEERMVDLIVLPIKNDDGRVLFLAPTGTDITERKRAEAQLREHSETLEGILAASVDHLYIVDRSGRYRHVSDGGARIVGFTPSDMKGRHWTELGLPTDLMEAFDAQREQVILTGQPAQYEAHLPLSGGAGCDFEYSIAPIVGADRQTDAVVVVSRDVTKYKIAERVRLDLLKALETQNAFFSAVLTQVPVGIVVADAATGKLLMSNEESHRIVQHEYETGRRLEDYGNTFILEAFRRDGSRYETGEWPLERAILGETIIGEEIELVRRSQSRVTIRVNAGPIRVGEELVAAVVAVHDITDRKAIEQSARFLADASAMLSGLVDLENTLQTVASLAVPTFADWAVVDIAVSDGPGRRLAVAHSDPSKAGLALEISRRFPSVATDSQGSSNILRTGRSQWTSEITDSMLVAYARNDQDLQLLRDLEPQSYIGVPLTVRGKTLGVLSFLSSRSGRRFCEHDLAVAEDLASRAAIAIENARLYQELKEADRSKNEFLATLAHELRNPLAPIRNVLHLLREPSSDGDSFGAERAMVERQVVHLTRLIDDLMDVARISQGKIELQKEVVDLTTIVNQAIETARPLIDSRRHRLRVSQPAEPIRLEADPTRLEQILWNLLNNAAKYSEPGGQIDLVVDREGSEVVLRMKDRGIGIKPEMLPRIFGMFVQVGDHKNHALGGLGIGLSLVKTLVDMHGGSISAQSDGPDMGSEFVVRLPVLPPITTEFEPPRIRGTGRNSGLICRRVLVVDDNEDAARSLARVLTRIYGQDVRVAHDGPSALTAAEEFRPEVVVLDIGMPGMDGYELARRLRSQPETQAACLVALTGWGQEEDLKRSREAGFDRHLVKPVDPDDLRDLLGGE